MMSKTQSKSICIDCFHSYVCEQFNEHRECDNKKCHFANDHFVSAADVVEVVRCKDCKWFEPYEGEEHKGDCAELVGLESCVYEDDFCSYGERRETE